MKLFFIFIGELQGSPHPPLMGLQAPLRQWPRHEDETRPPDVAATHLSGSVVRADGPDGHAEGDPPRQDGGRKGGGRAAVAAAALVVGRVEVGKRFGKHGGNSN
ncbi:unnamed protein product [Pleuronectes platessa]|uniref:Uncharacterized protein n=1 Tax=Pleuronectes platessa TaxID=8262 RepID=A0A9N7UUI0_PLEPL|nr:unnamed protein product [Pleuronectes platessa]